MVIAETNRAEEVVEDRTEAPDFLAGDEGTEEATITSPVPLAAFWETRTCDPGKAVIGSKGWFPIDPEPIIII